MANARSAKSVAVGVFVARRVSVGWAVAVRPTGVSVGADSLGGDVDGNGFADLVVATPGSVGRVVGFRGADLAARGQAPVFEDYSAAFDPTNRNASACSMSA